MSTYKVETGKEKGITKIYSPSEEEERIRKHVYDRKRQMGDARSKFDKDWDKWEKQWDGFRAPKDRDDWKSNINIPITSSIVESMLSELNNQDLMPWVNARGSEDETKAAIMNAILAYSWDTAKSNVSLFNIIKDALIFGTGIGMEYYWKEPRMVKSEDGKTTREVLEYDDPYLEPVRLWDFYVDERARGFSGPFGARDCIRRYIMDIDDFNSFFKGKTWDPFGNAKLVKAGGDTNYYEYYTPPERIEHDHEVEVLWYWNKPDDLLAIVANDVVVKSGPNPYKHKQLPFVRVLDVVRPYQFYGKGESELVESLSEEKNTLRRMIIDRNHLDIDKPVFVSDNLTLEDEDTITRPHGIVPVGDVNQIKFAEYGDIPMSVFKSLELLGDDTIRVTGMDERQQSVSQAGTATEAAILKEATLKRLNLKIWQIKNDTLVDLGKLRVANILQFYSEPKLEEIIGEAVVAKAKALGILVEKEGKSYAKKFRTVRLQDQKMDINAQTKQPEILPSKGASFFEAKPEFFIPSHGGYDISYKATSSTPISRPLEQQKADEMYDRLIQNPTIDPWKLAEFLIQSREKDPDNFKAQAQGPQQDQGVSLEKMIDLAGSENDEMLRGNKIGPTPYASPVHTEVHIEFIKSKKFKEQVPPDDKKTLQIFTDHVMGEIMAQQARGASGAEGASPNGVLAGSPNGGAPAAPQGPQMGNVLPGRIEGGGQVPSGMPGVKAGITGK
jgi:hypothetical protein